MLSRDALCEAGNAIVSMMTGRELPVFRKQGYTATLEGYAEELRSVFGALEKGEEDDSLENLQKPAAELADIILRALEEDLKKRPKTDRALQQDAYRMFVVTFLSPALQRVKDPMAQNLCEALRLRWQATWPKQAYRVVTAETISAGFDKKWYQCYITQATCEYLGKADDCAELTLFRAFRDGYLRQCADGESLIEAYYATAPAIVQRIAFSAERDEIYRWLWRDYLSLCYEDLLQEKKEACRARYCRMVHALEERFLPRALWTAVGDKALCGRQ